jgi:DNA N-6-adenine-methyltransferase Dam
VHKSSKFPHYCTPPELLDLVWEIGPITLDPFANKWSTPIMRASMEFHLERGEDAWVLPWPVGAGVAFCNPKYGRTMPRSIAAMNRCAADGGTVVALVAARPDTLWLQEANAQLICFWRGRVRFLDPRTGMQPTEAGACFPSAFLIWSEVGWRLDAFVKAFGPKGRVVDWQQHRV